MLETGTTAPPFSLPGVEADSEFERYQLTDYTSGGVVMLAFYPFDFSPVCVSELCAFRDAEWLMMREGVDVFGISRDACYAHRRFIEEYNLPFPLLSDVEGTVTDDYGIRYDEWELHEGVPKRCIFVLDDDRTIRYRWTTEDAYDVPDLYEVADAIAEIPYVDVNPDELL